jgi:hypothetical protein
MIEARKTLDVAVAMADSGKISAPDLARAMEPLQAAWDGGHAHAVAHPDDLVIGHKGFVWESMNTVASAFLSQAKELRRNIEDPKEQFRRAETVLSMKAK